MHVLDYLGYHTISKGDMTQIINKKAVWNIDLIIRFSKNIYLTAWHFSS